MDFRLELQVKPFANQIQLQDPILLIGSCFTDHISKRLALHKFKVLENPHGILFNPRSIETAVMAYIGNKQYQQQDLFLFNDLYTSWDHHGQFSHPDADTVLKTINDAVSSAHGFLKDAKWVIITLGSSWVYELKNDSLGGKEDQAAANCHKVPQQHFKHRLLTDIEVNESLQHIVSAIQAFNPSANIIFTISPVRHHREGLVENNRSKALLISGVHQVLESNSNIFYFPSYELIIDDLRDYRFYAEDLVHPNYQATQYVWEKFVAAGINESTQKDMEEINKLVHAKNHRSLHPSSKQHQQFLATMLERAKLLQQRLTGLDFSDELAYFSKQL
ncbi:MAG: GSCFA domain-containing protein [Bacteroidota bacterium]